MVPLDAALLFLALLPPLAVALSVAGLLFAAIGLAAWWRDGRG